MHTTPERFSNWCLDNAKSIFTERGRLTLTVVLLVQRHPETGESLPEPMAVPMFFVSDAKTFEEDSAAKDTFADAVRAMARDFVAVASMFMAETWVLMGQEAAGRGQWGRTRSLEDHPRRKEAIFAVMEHRAFPGQRRTWLAIIDRDAKNQAILQPFNQLPNDAEADGRFTNLLPEQN